MIRLPAPLRPGDVVAVTAPSSGVPMALRPRLDVAVARVRALGYEVVTGDCLDSEGVTSAPARQRAEELTRFLLDPTVRAVVPPWGGELAVELLPHLDLPALAAAEPTWLVGYSDLSTLTLPLTVAAGVATLHGPNLMDTPYRVPEPLLPWWDVLARPTGSTVVQGASRRHRARGRDDWQADPAVTEPTFDTDGSWSLLDPGAGDLDVSGRLVGGCLECVSTLAGTPWGDVRAFADAHAPEGVVVHVEAAEAHALDVARMLWRLRLAGWFDAATAVLVGRTAAPAAGGFTQLDAVRSALGDLDLPVVLDVDCGHVPPQLALVDGALARVTVSGGEQRLVQVLA